MSINNNNISSFRANRAIQYKDLEIDYKQIIIMFILTQFLCWLLLEILERCFGMQPAIRKRTSFIKLPKIENEDSHQRHIRSQTLFRMSRRLDRKGRFRIQTRGAVYFVKTIWMLVGWSMIIAMLITRPEWYLDHFYWLIPGSTNVQLYPLTTAMIASYYTFEMATNRYAKLQWSILVHHWISVAAATVTITGTFSPLLSWYAIIGIFTAGVPLNFALGFRANWAYKYPNFTKKILKFGAYWYFMHIFLIFGGGAMITLNMWLNDYYSTVPQYFRFSYTIAAALAFGYNDIITLRALFELSRIDYTNSKIDHREPSKSQKSRTQTHQKSQILTPNGSHQNGYDSRLVGGHGEWTETHGTIMVDDNYEDESEWELEAWPINGSPQSGFTLNLDENIFKSDEDFQLDAQDHKDVAYVAQMAAGLTYAVSADTVVSRQNTGPSEYGALSATTSNRTIPTFNTTTSPHFHQNRIQRTGSLGVPSPANRQSSNQSIPDHGTMDNVSNPRYMNTNTNNTMVSYSSNIYNKAPSDTGTATKPKHHPRDQQISMSFSTSTANFIPLNSAAAYFAKDQPIGQPPPILTDMPPEKKDGAKDEYSKPSTINEDQEMTPKKIRSQASNQTINTAYATMAPSNSNLVRSPQTPSNFITSDDDEPSAMMSIPDIKRASAKMLAQKKLNGRNVSQSDTKILNAAWNFEYNGALEDLKQDIERHESDPDPDLTMTNTNEKGMTYIVQPGMGFSDEDENMEEFDISQSKSPEYVNALKRDSGNTARSGDSTKNLSIDTAMISPDDNNPNNQTTPMLIHLMQQKGQRNKRATITPLETPTETIQSYPDTPEKAEANVNSNRKGKHITFSSEVNRVAASPAQESITTTTSPTDDSNMTLPSDSSAQPEPKALMNHMSLHTIRSSQSDYDEVLRRKSEKLRQQIIHEETPREDDMKDLESPFEIQTSGSKEDDEEKQDQEYPDETPVPSTPMRPIAVGQDASTPWETDDEPIPDLMSAAETHRQKTADIDNMIHPALKSNHSAPARKSIAEIKDDASGQSQITVSLQKANDQHLGGSFTKPGTKKIKGRPRIGSAPRQSGVYTKNKIKPIDPPRRPSRSKSRNSRSILSAGANGTELKPGKSDTNDSGPSSNPSMKKQKSHVTFDENTKENSMKAKGLSRHSSAREPINHFDISAQKRRSFHVSSATQPQITFKTPISAKNIGDKLGKEDPNMKVKNLGFVQVTNTLTGKKETLFLRKKKKTSKQPNNHRKRRKVIKMHSQQFIDHVSSHNEDDDKEEFFSDEELKNQQKRFPEYHKRVSKHRNYASEHVTQSPSNKNKQSKLEQVTSNTATLKSNLSNTSQVSQTPVPTSPKKPMSNMDVPKHQVYSSSPTDASAYSITNTNNNGNVSTDNSPSPMPSPIMNVMYRNRDRYDTLHTNSNFSTPSIHPRSRIQTYESVATQSGLSGINRQLSELKLDTNATATPSNLMNAANALPIHMTPTNEEEEMKSFKPMRSKPKMKKLHVQISDDITSTNPYGSIIPDHNLGAPSTPDGGNSNGNGNNARSHIMMVDLKSESDALSLGDHGYYMDDIEESMISRKSSSKNRKWHKRMASKLSDFFAVDGRFDDDGIYIDELDYGYYGMDDEDGNDGYQNDHQ